VIKENLKNSRITGLNLQGKTIKVAGDFLTETWQARREWYDMFKVLNGKNTLSIKAVIQTRRRDKEFPRQKKLKKFVTTRPTLQYI